MTNRELSQLYYLNREIAHDKERLAEVIAAATNTSAKITGLPHAAGTSDKTALAVEIAYLKDSIKNKLRQSYREYNRLTSYINSVEDSHVRQIMMLRYISGLNWVQIAHHTGGGNTADSVKKICYRFVNKAQLKTSKNNCTRLIK